MTGQQSPEPVAGARRAARPAHTAQPGQPTGTGYPDAPVGPPNGERAAPGPEWDYADMPDYPPHASSWPVSGRAGPHATADDRGSPAASGCPETPGYPEAPGYLPFPYQPTAPGHRPASGEPSPGQGRPVGHPAAPNGSGTHHGDGYQASSTPSSMLRTGPLRDAQRARLAYVTVPLTGFLMPLAVYVIAWRRSRWLRTHAAQALNVWVTQVLYDMSAAIIATMLALDSPLVALLAVLPVVILLWLTTVIFLLRAAAAASRGEEYTFPRWLCARIVR